MLGDFCDAIGTRRETADYITSVPFQVASIDETQPIEALLSFGILSLLGKNPNISIASSDGKVRFAIPESAAQTNDFLGDLRAGKTPTEYLIMVDDDDTSGSSFGNCAQCFQVEELKKCARCNLIPYCSKECQRKHWKLHKLQCKGS
mmetsp:Transcript_18241/g.29669  ORF Transcript_18241/g.29669 Transcript_18241/m.29669 type:complete len:147 (+) Transcript_18241:803-1243(+)